MKKIILALTCFTLFLLINGCVNVNQKAKIEKDGSGSLTLHYWTKMKNAKNKQEIGGFSFDEQKIKSKYSSTNNSVENVKVEEKLNDSTKHVYVDIDFKNINNLNSATGYSKVTPSWKEGKEGMEFKYIIKKDTSAAKNMDSHKYELVYEFEFPDEVLQTNGLKDGKSVKWEKTLKDLKEDLEFTATVKSDGEGSSSSEKKDGKKCGLFGIELPFIFLLGMIGITLINRQRKR